MARYFKTKLARANPPKPEPKSTSGLQPYRRLPAMAPMLGQDQLAGAHAQTIARGGLNGADDWMVGGDDANPNGSDWPDQGVQRTSAAGLTRILPGHAVQIRIIYMPSGLCDDGVT